MMTPLQKRDIATGIIVMLLAVLVVAVLIPIGVVEPKKIKFAALSPSYYPRLVGYCLFAMGLLIVVSRFRQRNAAASEAPAAERRPWYIGVLLIAMLALFYISLPVTGFVLGSSILLVALLLLAGERRWLPIGAISLVVPLLLYVFFTRVANIPIPTGVLQPWLVF